MRRITLQVVLFLSLQAGLATLAAVEIPEALSRKTEQLFSSLEEAANRGSTFDQYLQQLVSLGAEVDLASKALLLKEPVSDSRHGVICLALKAGENKERIVELSDWYGRWESEVPRARREVEGKRMAAHGYKLLALEDPNYFTRQHGRKVEPLRFEHAKEEYRTAWEIWLLAPASKERDMMFGRICAALSKIKNPQSVPLLVEAFRICGRTKWEQSRKRDAGISVASVIADIGGEGSVDALLECNQIAKNEGFSGDGAESVAAKIVRLLSGRRYFADLNPDLPGAVAHVDERWRVFRPMIEKKLANGGALSVDSRELLQAALKAMP